MGLQDKNEVHHQISILLFVGLSCGVLMLSFTQLFGPWAVKGFAGPKNLHIVPSASIYVRSWNEGLYGTFEGFVGCHCCKWNWSCSVLCSLLGYGIAGAAFSTMASQEELLKLEPDDAQVEEYLVANNLLKKRPGSFLLKGRGVTNNGVGRAKYEEEAKKKAGEKVDLVRPEYNAKIEALKDQFTIVIQNMVAKLQSNDLQQQFTSFNPFEGCPNFDSGSDDSYVPDGDSADDESCISLISEE